MVNKNDSKIQYLEETLAHQSSTIDDLSQVITKQWQSIDRLEKKVTALVERFLVLEEASEGSIENTKPPHY